MSNACEFISGDCIYPCPMVNEAERQQRFEEYRLQIWQRGYVIEKEWRVRNHAFDKKGEKTTAVMRIRRARTQDEADFLMSKFGGNEVE